MDARSFRFLPALCLTLGLVLFFPGTGLPAAETPVTVKELCLMLRGGYTGDEVLRETAARPLLEPLDANAEKSLREAGADSKFIAAFKTAHHALSGDEALAALQRQAEIDRRNEQSRELSQARVLAQPPPVALAQGNSRRMADLLHGKLVTMRDGQERAYEDAALAGKKYFALYFSALWCGPCRKFTPQFVEFYKQFAPSHPELEVVFVSSDHSAFDMDNYMRQDGMTWPALSFERKAQEPEITRYAGSGIPDLVVLDASGKVLLDSYHGNKYIGPQRVLADLGQLLVAKGALAGQ